jgi:hypothetical protein
MIRRDPRPRGFVAGKPVLHQDRRDAALLRGAHECLSYPPPIVANDGNFGPDKIDKCTSNLDVRRYFVEALEVEVFEEMPNGCPQRCHSRYAAVRLADLYVS